jgi:ubiquinone/menaquinone biosynthesis C-methylase UbiE
MPADDHLTRIQRQFRRQADAYAQLASVRDVKGLRAVVALSGATADARVLDVACGPAFLTMEFAARCRRVVGADATDRFVADARAEAARRGVANLDFVLADVETLPLPDGIFDLAVCRAAFHHFPQPQRVLGEMMRVTARRGRLLVMDQIASEDPEKAAYHNRIERLCDPTHVKALAASEFRRLFDAAGLTLVHVGTSKIPYRLSDWMHHGGPTPAAAREIEALMRASVDADRTGLEVHLEHGEVWFSHTGAAFLLEKPG